MAHHFDQIPTAAGPPIEPDLDPVGQASLLLVESLIHGLIAGGTLSIEQAVEIIDVAAEIKVNVADELGERAASMNASLALLRAMAGSLRRDLGG